MNNDKPELVGTLLEKLAVAAQRQLKAGHWNSFKHTLRFLACIQDLFADQGVFSVLKELFERTIDLQSESPDDVVGLVLVKIILLTVPYAIASGAAGIDSEVTELLEKTNVVASAPHSQPELVKPYHSPDDPLEPPNCPTALRCLQLQLGNEAAEGWPLKFIPRFFGQENPEAKNGEVVEDMKVDSSKHAFPTIIVPSPVNPGLKTIMPDVFFSMFAGQEQHVRVSLTSLPQYQANYFSVGTSSD